MLVQEANTANIFIAGKTVVLFWLKVFIAIDFQSGEGTVFFIGSKVLGDIFLHAFLAKHTPNAIPMGANILWGIFSATRASLEAFGSFI